jgi:CheY-like chemotaxis protein
MKLPYIIITEDDPGDQYLFQTAVAESDASIHVEHAYNGFQLLGLLLKEDAGTHARRPELIITDMRMPFMNGLEILRKLKENSFTNTIPVYIFSAHYNEEDKEECLQSGAHGFFRKPDTLAELKLLIGNILTDVET